MPLLYEVNTRAWLAELSDAAGETITLVNLPDSEIDQWIAYGFTHVWLMGIWTIGPLAREHALGHWRAQWSKEILCTESDVHGSPFAIQDYSIDPRLGEPLAVMLLRERLRAAGIKLIVDFVPNHYGIDTAEAYHYPHRFVHSREAREYTFPKETKLGIRYFAHGRDPHFPAWTDTVQVDYRVHDTHDAMAAVAQTLVAYSDGLRCDMAMLLQPDIFYKTWRDFPPQTSNPCVAEFWRHAIARIKQTNPNADLIAEVYWDREEQLQNAGFDFTYNKRVTDYIMRRQFADLRQFLLGCSPEYLRRSIHFLENHDEARAASALPLELHKASALLILALPGMPLLHQGQLEGRRQFARIQLVCRPREEPDPAIEDFYRLMLKTLPATAIRNGTSRILKTAEPDLIVVEWTSTTATDLAVINLTSEPRQCPWTCQDLLFSTTPRNTPASVHRGIAPESAVVIRRPIL